MTNEVPPRSVVHVLAPAPFGGLETCVLALATGLHAAGDDVSVVPVLTPDDASPHPLSEALERCGVRVEPIVVRTRHYREEQRAVERVLRARSASVLHTHGFRPDVVDAPVARRLGLPTVTTVHGFAATSFRGRVYEWLQKRAFRRFDAVIAVSERLRKDLATGGVPDDRLVSLRNAWEPTEPFLSRDAARKALGIATEGVVVGWVGRLSTEKAPDVFVRAAGRIGLRLQEPAFSVIGDGPMLEECRTISRTEGVAKRFLWHGSVQRAGTLLAALDVLVLTSWTEGTPMVLLEAMAAGVPIVTTAVGGIPDVVSPSEAILCPAGDIAQIAEGVESVVNRPAEARIRADAARSRVAHDFAVAPWIAHHRRLYHSLTPRS